MDVRSFFKGFGASPAVSDASPAGSKAVKRQKVDQPLMKMATLLVVMP